MNEQIGVYECLAVDCPKRATPVEKPWDGDWPLEKRQHECESCGTRMLLVTMKRSMTDEVKQRLRDLMKERQKPC